MRTYTILKSDNYMIMAWTWDQGGAWGHEAHIIAKNGQEIGQGRIRYYNRTWEAWEYQTAIRLAIEDLEHKKRAELEEEKRAKYGGRLPRGSKQEIARIVEASEDVAELLDCWRNYNKVEV